MQCKINVQFQVLLPSRNATKDVASCDYVILQAMKGKGGVVSCVSQMSHFRTLRLK